MGFLFEQAEEKNCIPTLMNEAGMSHFTTELVQVFSKGKLNTTTHTPKKNSPVCTSRFYLLCSDHCFNNNCAGGSTCVEEYGTYTCVCGSVFTGSYCKSFGNISPSDVGVYIMLRKLVFPNCLKLL